MSDAPPYRYVAYSLGVQAMHLLAKRLIKANPETQTVGLGFNSEAWLGWHNLCKLFLEAS